MYLKKYFLKLSFFFFIGTQAYADNFPIDNQGDFLPSPVGNISYIHLPQAMISGKEMYTWTYMGTLINAADQQSLSFEGVISQQFISNDSLSTKNTAVGFHTLQFAFKDGADLLYVNSAYGGEDKVAQALVQSLDMIKSKTILDNYSVTTTPLANNLDTWHLSSLPARPVSPLYKGLVGQPGHQYQLNGTGTTFLWRYSTNGQVAIQNYRYRFLLNLLDQRGIIAEGFGGGYVGAALTDPKQTSRVVFEEYEIGHPRLKAVNWTIELQAINSKLPKGFKPNYIFNGNDGMLWGDIGPLVGKQLPDAKQFSELINQYQPNLAAYFPANKMLDKKMSLYNGNWIVMQLTQGKYKGAALVVVPFWNKPPIDSTNYPNTDDLSWCVDGFADLYTGILENDVASAYTIPEVLIPGNPTPILNPPAHWVNPFTVRYLKMSDPKKYGLLYPWVQQLEVTINPYSQIRYALAAYAHRQNQFIKDDVSQPVRIVITTISPITENIMFTKDYTQMYEGAATATINDETVGTAWVEEMIRTSN